MDHQVTRYSILSRNVSAHIFYLQSYFQSTFNPCYYPRM